MEREDSEPVGHKGTCPCDDPSESFQLYGDGHGYCFAGGCPHPHWSAQKLIKAGWDVEAPEGSAPYTPRQRPERMSEEVLSLYESGVVRALTKWNISQATTRHWDYRTRANSKGEAEHLAVYRDETGSMVDIKVRNTGVDGSEKRFYWASGKAPKNLLYGIHLLPQSGKMLVIAMGEKDAMTISQLWANKFPVVSPAGGEAAAHKDVAAHLERLLKFEKIVLVPHADPAGFKAMERVAAVFPAGKVFIARLPLNDANDMHMEGRDQELISLIHNAPAHRPDGIVDAADLDDELLNPTAWGAKLPYDFLYKWTYGLLPGQIWVIGAGTGVGKSDLMAEIVAHHIQAKEEGGSYQRAAVFNYEAGPKRTSKIILGKLWSKRFNIPDPEDGSENLYWSREDLLAAIAYRREKCAKIFLNDHQGRVDWASVKERLRFLVHTEGITLGVVDPVAALVAAEADKNAALELLFAEAKMLAEELGITLLFVSHLARPKDGKNHEEGGRVTMAHFRGSAAITMWASFVLAMERDQQGDEEDRKDTTLRMLKDRETGDSTGQTRVLIYNTLTGRLEEAVSMLDEGADPEAPPL